MVFFNRLAEIAVEYLRKGSKVYIEGALRTRKWQAQDGSDRYSTEIVANEMQMLDTRGGGAGGMGGDDGYDQSSYPEASGSYSGGGSGSGGGAAAGSAPGAAAPRPQPQPMDTSDIDDDIPF